MDEILGVKGLKEVKEVLDNHHIVFFLDLGTLLGAVRDSKFIGWDRDIDLGMVGNIEEVMDAIPDLEKRGFWVNWDKYPSGVVYGKGFSIVRPGCHVELTVYEIVGEDAIRSRLAGTNPASRFLYEAYVGATIMHGPIQYIKRPNIPSLNIPLLSKFIRWIYRASGVKEIGWVVPRGFFENFGKLEFYHTVYSVPSSPQLYLALHYGHDWRTPKRVWNYTKDDNCFREIIR